MVMARSVIHMSVIRYFNYVTYNAEICTYFVSERGILYCIMTWASSYFYVPCIGTFLF